MHGPASTFLLAEIAIPDAWQCFTFLAPFLAFFALRWVVLHMDVFLDRLFPHWEWEKQMGWLNIRTERRAKAVLRWLGYLIYAILALALYGIVWAAPIFTLRDHWQDPTVAAQFAIKLPVLLVSVGLWLLYFGCELIPKLCRQYETDELERFRAEQAEIEQEKKNRFNPGSRLAPNQNKPGLGLPSQSGRLGPRR